MQWQPMMEGLGDLLAVIPTTPSSAIESTALGMGLGSVFTPTFMCSSTQCKALVTDVATVIQSVGGSSMAGVANTAWCPAGEIAGKTVDTAFVVAGDVASFDATKQANFKQGIVDTVNAGLTDSLMLITKSNVALAISAASINVVASITVASQSLVTAATTTMTALAASPAAAGATLGVTVESASAPTTTDVAAVTAVAVTPAAAAEEAADEASSGLSTGVLIGIIVGGVAAVVLIVIVVMCMMKKKKPVKVTGGGSAEM